MGAGEISIFGKLVAKTADGKIAKAKQIEGLTELIETYIQPSEDKEVIAILTASPNAPSSAEDGDLYINTSNNTLLVYDDGAWTATTASTEVVYVTADTSHIYIYNGETFVDSTGEAIDNTIYVSNLTTDLADYTHKGMYAVCLNSGNESIWYTLAVSGARMRKSGVIQTLSNKSGYQTRNKKGNDPWSDWTVKTYVTDISDLQAKLTKLEKISKAALVL